MQPISAQQRLANLEIVGARVDDGVERSVDVVLSESGLKSVQKWRESVGLALEI
ncbi:MAG: hypothetical protein CLLPBCKN_007023 [Chroococcidiopsis cubana SAG 39.79]|uniref:Uncharacterized protein n=1 Tax=Chroococcidiopsis cubana SAG 39.79 TaxID=388085 RepID=A0AB37UCV4_9CYAN|nr:hypothetical protein [Chroococcidiopsis cubana SAG 39.79]RUT05342.1 hypothetical protein DSM107010_56140 [Chroococcidiopsis cubana SAG 39.79]